MTDQRAVAASEIAMALVRLTRMAELHGLDLLTYLLDTRALGGGAGGEH